MHRTQLYIDEDIFSKVKKASSSLNISISEFIRVAINKQLQQKNSQQSMSSFFEQLKPLESYNNIDASEYVVDLREKSRLIND